MIVYNSSRIIFTNCTIAGDTPSLFNIQMRNNTDTIFIGCHFKYNSLIFSNVTNATVTHCTFQYLDLNNDTVLSIQNGTANFQGNAYWNYFILTGVENVGFREGDILPKKYNPTNDSLSFYSVYLFGLSSNESSGQGGGYYPQAINSFFNASSGNIISIIIIMMIVCAFFLLIPIKKSKYNKKSSKSKYM